MLTKRIIPCLDIKNGRVVKGVQFKGHLDMGDPAELAQKYSDQGADELVFYDITASPEDRAVDFSWVERVAEKVNIPFSVAGGIRSVETALKVFRAGADKVSINTPALERPELINELAEAFGSQAVVVGTDVTDGQLWMNTGNPLQSSNTKKSALQWITEVQDRGAGEIVINSMAQDGMKNGYDIDFLTQVARIARVPVIASGGAGTMEHFRDVLTGNIADGALAASVFHSGDITIPQLKYYLSQYDVPIRR